MAVEIDDSQALQDGNSLGQFPPEHRFVGFGSVPVHSTAPQLAAKSRVPMNTAAQPMEAVAVR